MIDATKLKPCPFCGNVEPKMIYVVTREEQYWYVSCPKYGHAVKGCGARGGSNIDTEAGAICNWNDRRAETSMAALLAAVLQESLPQGSKPVPTLEECGSLPVQAPMTNNLLHHIRMCIETVVVYDE